MVALTPRGKGSSLTIGRLFPKQLRRIIIRPGFDGDVTGGQRGKAPDRTDHPTFELRLEHGNRGYVFLRFDFAFQAGQRFCRDIVYQEASRGPTCKR